ncbi:MAG: PQQ-binding-like beta-propeller repeat protein [Acidobacteriia bacterium]|nr:PQQ-binding-like beta-propeller repeat protein [Terriglobia bacterium]
MRTIAFLSLIASAAFAADPDGAALYKQHCAICHENSGATRAPAPAALRLMSPENVVKALESGVMKDQGAALSAGDKENVAEFLTGKMIGAQQAATVGMCSDVNAFSPTGKNWNGWGADLANTRFQPAETAGLTADQVSKLKLKWVFAFPNTFLANGSPTVVGGRIFVASANRKIYSLDAKSGCQYWAFEAEAGVRTAITVAQVDHRQVAMFGDQRATAYSVDASTGELIWKIKVDDHPRSKIVGAPAYLNGKLYVPITAGEETSPINPKYECCTGRGALAALDAATGKTIWKSFTVTETPHPTGETKSGTRTWGPSGASIWSAPTIDTERKIIYVATGDNFSEPATKTSDAVIAYSMETGKMLWATQFTENDAYNSACHLASRENCPPTDGPDFDLGASPILVKLANGKRVLLVSQKSGVAHGLDADSGKVMWEHRVGRGGTLGGIQWGSASDGKNMYVANSDISWTKGEKEFSRDARGNLERRTVDPKTGGGLFAIDAATGKRVWAAAPAVCGEQPMCSPAQSAAVTAIPGVIFSGGVDGHMRAYSSRDGKVIWDFDTAREFETVNGLKASGGAIDGPGPTVAGGMVYVPSGYGIWGGKAGNVLLAFGE